MRNGRAPQVQLRRPACLVVLFATLILSLLPAAADAALYWVSQPESLAAAHIARANLDGTRATPILSEYTVHAPIVASSQYLYYASQTGKLSEGEEGGGIPVEVRTNLEGGERLELSGLPSHAVGAVEAVDGEHIYWQWGGQIGRANLAGGEVESEFLEIGPSVDFAIYGNYLYWGEDDQGFGTIIGRANLKTKVVDPEFANWNATPNPPEGVSNIAAGPQGIFWSYYNGQGAIGHASLGGGTAAPDAIPAAEAWGTSSIATEGTEVYWHAEPLGGFTIGHAHVVNGGSAFVFDTHFITEEQEEHQGLALNSAVAPSAPPPVEPPHPLGPPPPPATPPTPVPAPKITIPANAFKSPKVKLNEGLGTATLAVGVPGPGKLTLTGKGLVALTKTVKKPGTVMLTVTPNGKTKKALAKKGTVKVTAKVTFTPTGGTPNTEPKPLTLKLE